MQPRGINLAHKKTERGFSLRAHRERLQRNDTMSTTTPAKRLVGPKGCTLHTTRGLAAPAGPPTTVYSQSAPRLQRIQTKRFTGPDGHVLVNALSLKAPPCPPTTTTVKHHADDTVHRQHLMGPQITVFHQTPNVKPPKCTPTTITATRQTVDNVDRQTTPGHHITHTR